MADQDYPTLYADLELSAVRTRNASLAFEAILGGPDSLAVPVRGYPDQQTIGGRFKAKTDPLVNTLIAETQGRMDAIVGSIEGASQAVMRFAGAVPVAPTKRADNTALQAGDEYQNTTNGLRYGWSGTAWIALNANVQQILNDLAVKNDPLRGAGMSGHRQGTVATYLDSVTSGLGDFNARNLLQIHIGDSTTEQAGAAGYLFDFITNFWRTRGMPCENMLGTLNFGGSGYTLKGFVNDAVNNAFVGPTGAMPGVTAGPGQWDYYGHKPSGSVSLATALKYRGALPANVDRVQWVMCYGINDLILYNDVGLGTIDQIADYITDLVNQAVGKIQAAFPGDTVVLRMPNPMAARPFNAAFPSSSAYPTFDSDEPLALQLVENWNQGLRQGYLQAQNTFPRTVLFDTWEHVFGDSTPAVQPGQTATTNPLFQDRVHPGRDGYRMLGHELCNLLFGNAQTKQAYNGRRFTASLKKANGWPGEAWDYDPQFFRNNQAYKELGTWNLVGAGAAYMDVAADPVALRKVLTGYGGGKIYCIVGTDKRTGLSFLMGDAPNITVTASGANSRLSGVAPPVGAQGTLATITFYTDNFLAPPSISGAGALVVGQSVFVPVMDSFPSGLASITVDTTLAISSNAVFNVYRHRSNTRTLIATITVPGNGFNKTIVSGTDFTAITTLGGRVRENWEIVPTTAASVPAGCAVRLTLTPN